MFQQCRRFSRHMVPNKESTARDQLANERTFLAWGRTGLGFVGAGLGYFIATTEDKQRLDDIHVTRIIPATGLLVLNGISILTFSLYRYFSVMKALQNGHYMLNQTGLIGILLFTGLNTSASLALIFQDRMDERARISEQNSVGGNVA